MKKLVGLVFLYTIFVFVSFACNQTQSPVPAAPAARSVFTQIYTDTFTPTITRTPTATTTPPTATASPTSSPTGTVPGATNTPNPSCPSNGDVTAYIDNSQYVGNDTGHILPASIDLDHGGGLNGDLLTFTLSSSETLNIGLCATEDLNRNLDIYVRPVCNSTTSEYYSGPYCAGLGQIANMSLSAGSYYIILSEDTNSDGPGAYALRIKSGSIASAVCTVVPTVTPIAVPSGTYNSCSAVFAFNSGAAASGERIATGQLDDTTNTDDFYSVIPTSSGTVTVTLDCFDNGMNNVDFDIFAAASCPTGSTPPLIGSSATTDPVEQFTFPCAAGSTYYIDVEAYLGSGSYRLTVQTP